jgi:hypothetical protein
MVFEHYLLEVSFFSRRFLYMVDLDNYKLAHNCHEFINRVKINELNCFKLVINGSILMQTHQICTKT